jgi:hypothetical protein
MGVRSLTAAFFVPQVRGFTPPELVNAVAVAEDKSLFGMLRCALRHACIVAMQRGLDAPCCTHHGRLTCLPLCRSFMQSGAGDPFFAVIATRERR